MFCATFPLITCLFNGYCYSTEISVSHNNLTYILLLACSDDRYVHLSEKALRNTESRSRSRSGEAIDQIPKGSGACCIHILVLLPSKVRRNENHIPTHSC